MTNMIKLNKAEVTTKLGMQQFEQSTSDSFFDKQLNLNEQPINVNFSITPRIVSNPDSIIIDKFQVKFVVEEISYNEVSEECTYGYERSCLNSKAISRNQSIRSLLQFNDQTNGEYDYFQDQDFV